MSSVIYTKIRELETLDKEVYEFGNWLRNFEKDSHWESSDEETEDFDGDEDMEIPKNKKGMNMDYPWNDFSFVVIPDTENHIQESEKIASLLGSYERYDIEDSDRTFFVVK